MNRKEFMNVDLMRLEIEALEEKMKKIIDDKFKEKEQK